MTIQIDSKRFKTFFNDSKTVKKLSRSGKNMKKIMGHGPKLRVVFSKILESHFSKSSWTKTEFFFGFSMKFCLKISYDQFFFGPLFRVLEGVKVEKV
jgi:hypothetical protein